MSRALASSCARWHLPKQHSHSEWHIVEIRLEIVWARERYLRWMSTNRIDDRLGCDPNSGAAPALHREPATNGINLREEATASLACTDPASIVALRIPTTDRNHPIIHEIAAATGFLYLPGNFILTIRYKVE